MARFSIQGVEYEGRMLDGETQALVAKRLAAVLGAVAFLSAEIADVLPTDRPPALADVRPHLALLMPIARELAAMNDADVKFVMDACLRVALRQVEPPGVGWVPVLQNGVMNHQNDGSFAVRIGITWNVLAENFAAMGAMLGLGMLAAPQALTTGGAHA